MQTDVRSGHLNGSGFVYLARTRLKGACVTPSASAGLLNIFDTTSVPTTGGTYTRSGYTVTVTHTAHGFSNGQWLGLAFAAGTGGTATNGNYKITVLTADSYTITDINSGTITGTGAVTEATRWITSFDTTTNLVSIALYMPGEGIVCENGIYCDMTNLTGVTLFFG